MKLFLLGISVWANLCHAQVATVHFNQFQVGNYWEWTYSERKNLESAWTPYFFERYTVTAVTDKKITIDMSSSASLPIGPLAHHKMIVDFARCEKAAEDPRRRGFQIRFFTRSFGNGWQPTAARGRNLVFTEKFNCAQPDINETILYSSSTWQSAEHATFQIQGPVRRERSWYFLKAGALLGVAASKRFLPGDLYKFELSSFCNHGSSCGPLPN